MHIRDGAETRLGSKSTVELVPGDVISVRSCGGGGYGPPEEREPERVLRDVLEGKVSAERARDVYQVAIDGRSVDPAATATLRAEGLVLKQHKRSSPRGAKPGGGEKVLFQHKVS